jgi:hypothetical protein
VAVVRYYYETVCSPGVQKPVCKKRMGYEHKICTVAQKVGRAAPHCARGSDHLQP